MIRIYSLLLAVLFSASAWAAGGDNEHMMHANVDLSNQKSLQRGASVFVNYCMGCHSASYMRYNRIAEDLDITEDVLKENLMFGTDKPGDTMTIAMSKQDGEQYFGVAPPDLSVTARSRGADWLYTYFMTFYRDPSRPLGVNNLAFKDVGMPHVLWQLQGWQQPIYEEVVNEAGKTVQKIAGLELGTPGEQSPEEYEQTVSDLVNFMVYLGEPIQLKRKKIGGWVLAYLFVFLLITYLLKKEFWRDVH